MNRIKLKNDRIIINDYETSIYITSDIINLELNTAQGTVLIFTRMGMYITDIINQLNYICRNILLIKDISKEEKSYLVDLIKEISNIEFYEEIKKFIRENK